MRINLGAIASGIANKISDSFNRADSSSLGTSDDGSKWKAFRGTTSILSNKATTSTAHSSYPAASITVPSKNVDIKLQTGSTDGNGVGALLWATDSDNWWGVDVNSYSYSACTSNCISGYYGCGNSYAITNCVWGYLASYSYCSGGFNVRGTCNGYNHPYYKNGTYCKAYNWSCAGYSTNYQYVCVEYATNAYGNNAYCVSGYYCCGTTTYYPKAIRIIRSLAGTVSEIVSQVIGDNSTSVQSLTANIRNDQITLKAFSDVDATTQSGPTLTYTATGAAINTEYGIVFTPSSLNETNAIDSIVINRAD